MQENKKPEQTPFVKAAEEAIAAASVPELDLMAATFKGMAGRLVDIVAGKTLPRGDDLDALLEYDADENALMLADLKALNEKINARRKIAFSQHIKDRTALN